jgi:hypothetical protein
MKRLLVALGVITSVSLRAQEGSTFWLGAKQNCQPCATAILPIRVEAMKYGRMFPPQPYTTADFNALVESAESFNGEWRVILKVSKGPAPPHMLVGKGPTLDYAAQAAAVYLVKWVRQQKLQAK